LSVALTERIRKFFGTQASTKIRLRRRKFGSIAGTMDWKALTVSERLKVLRRACGDLSQHEMAVEIGIDPETDTYGKAERTGQVAQLAPRIYRRFPEIDAGWLFQGLTGNVHGGFEKRLSEAATALGLHSRRRDHG
jgi:DNA-binding XRE family transcriptional regulator